jgi:dipeptidyl aminopeptidase/acylaminoacyl peptidase
MATKRCEEVLGGLSLRQMLSMKASAGPDAPVWTADSQQLVFKSSLGGAASLWSVSLADGQLERLNVDLGVLPFLSNSLVNASPDGGYFSYTANKAGSDGREQSSRVEIWLQPTDGSPEFQLTSLGANINAYQWAGDGSAIVLSGNRFGRYDIYHVSVPDGKTTRLTQDDLYEVYPVFLPGNQEILYVRLDERWADHEIVHLSLQSGESRVVATDEDFFDYHYGKRMGHPCLSADGKTIAFPSHRSDWINYWQLPLDGGEPVQICPEPHDQTEGSFSVDGRFAFVSNNNGTASLVVVEADGSKRTLVAPEMGVVSGISWSPDGAQIAYLLQTPAVPSDLWVVSVADGKSRRLTTSPMATTLAPKMVLPEKVTYTSFDGLEISAYLYSPPQREPGQRFPGLLFIHGGPTSHFADTYYPQVQYFIRKGYAVLLPNIRGSSGYSKTFEDLNNGDWGHGDLRDVLAGVEFLKGLDYVDGENMGIHGTSYGGCMSMSAVGFAPGVFKASIPHAGYGDWLDFEEEQELRHVQLMRYEFGDLPENRHVYERCSPIYHVAKSTTPTFLVHGEGKYPRSDASKKFALALEMNYKTYEYKIYPNECYYVLGTENLCEMYPDIVDFLDRYLKG